MHLSVAVVLNVNVHSSLNCISAITIVTRALVSDGLTDNIVGSTVKHNMMNSLARTHLHCTRIGCLQQTYNKTCVRLTLTGLR